MTLEVICQCINEKLFHSLEMTTNRNYVIVYQFSFTSGSGKSMKMKCQDEA